MKKITKLFKFYKKDGATILTMNSNLGKFVETKEFSQFMKNNGFKVRHMNSNQFIDNTSTREVRISPGLSPRNLALLADLAVKTAHKKLAKGANFIAAIDCTQGFEQRVAIAF